MSNHVEFARSGDEKTAQPRVLPAGVTRYWIGVFALILADAVGRDRIHLGKELD